MNIQKSIEAFKRAKSAIAGGVNSPVRAYSSVDSTPLFMDRGKGSKVWDIDGNEYIDFVSSYGPLILGHAHPRIVEAVTKAAEKGTSFGAPTETETEIAELVKEMVPSIERIRFVNSGTEATMSGIRLARGYTGKDYIVKFSGCFHGHGDTFLIQAGSGVMTLGLPDSPGVTKGTAGDTLVAHYNDLESVQQLFDQYGDNIAGVILEPVAGNMGTVPPDPPFLKGLKKITKKHQSLLIFDEVMTGFRVARGGAQEYYDVTPDMTILGKIIGGGLPVGAFGGSKEIMEHLSPAGPVYQSGTLSGNPLAMSAGKAMLAELNKEGFYENMESKSKKIAEGMEQNIKEIGIPGTVNRVGSMMTLFFNEKEQINSFESASASDTKRYAEFFRSISNKGIYLAPSQFECMFVSEAHSDDDISAFLEAHYKALQEINS
ncbi:MAG: glutamate-1-semialdehyde 2,1-aminomutase [Bacteroidales bacterium]